jgi:hypothetical protein
MASTTIPDQTTKRTILRMTNTDVSTSCCRRINEFTHFIYFSGAQIKFELDEQEAEPDLHTNYRQNRQNFLSRTQANTAVDAGTQLDISHFADQFGDTTEFEAELDKLGIQVKTMAGERIFYIGLSRYTAT